MNFGLRELRILASKFLLAKKYHSVRRRDRPLHAYKRYVFLMYQGNLQICLSIPLGKLAQMDIKMTIFLSARAVKSICRTDKSLSR
jgi:hypothetical protein